MTRRLHLCLAAVLALQMLTAGGILPPRVWAAPSPTTDEIRVWLTEAAVRVEGDLPGQRAVCTGWIGWSEPTRSAIYTAGHCFRDGAQYRIVLFTGDRIPVLSLVRWEQDDLMALWISRGGLRTLRQWKPLPDGAFRALHVLNVAGEVLQVVETRAARVIPEMRFVNHPAAVAIPVASAPGTSGAPIVDAADGALVGMIVGYLTDRREIAAVVPARHVNEILQGGSAGTLTRIQRP